MINKDNFSSPPHEPALPTPRLAVLAYRKQLVLIETQIGFMRPVLYYALTLPTSSKGTYDNTA